MPDGQGAAATAAPIRHHAMARRRGDPGREYSAVSFRDQTITVVADDLGVIQPETDDQLFLCDRLGLPVIHDDEVVAYPDPRSKADVRPVAELRARAGELRVDIPKGAKRADLLALVEAAEAAADTDDDPTPTEAGDVAGEED